MMSEITHLNLFEQFESNLLYDCHSLAASINRSEAAKTIVQLGPQVLGELAAYLQAYTPRTKYPELEKKVQMGWRVLLVWLKDEHRLDDTPDSSHLQDWVKWAEEQTKNSSVRVAQIETATLDKEKIYRLRRNAVLGGYVHRPDYEIGRFIHLKILEGPSDLGFYKCTTQGEDGNYMGPGGGWSEGVELWFLPGQLETF